MRQLVGFIIILIATLLLGAQKQKKMWVVPKGFWLIILYDVMFAIIGILLKYSGNKSSFTQIISFESFGMGLGGIIIYFFIPAVRNAFLKSRRTLFKKALPLIVLNEAVFIIAKSLGYYAFILGPVALVSVLANVQVFFGLLFGWILTLFYPHTFNEKIAKRDMQFKVVCAVLLFAGLYCII